MKLYKVDAIVLRAKEFGEGNKLLTLFSRQRGKIRVVAYGVSKPGSRKRGAVQPFCYSEFLIYKGKELDSINQCEGREIFPGLTRSLNILGYAGYLAELVDCLTMEGEPDEKLFSLLITTFRLLSTSELGLSEAKLNGFKLNTFEQGKKDVLKQSKSSPELKKNPVPERSLAPDLLVRAFEIKVMSLSGYNPQLERCVQCEGSPGTEGLGFSFVLGGVLCKDCRKFDAKAITCTGRAIEILKIFLKWEPARLSILRVSQEARVELESIMRQFIGYRLEAKIKTIDFLEKIKPGG